MARRTAAQWAEVVAAYRRSGQTQTAFARSRGVGGFVPVRLIGEGRKGAVAVAASVEVQLYGRKSEKSRTPPDDNLLLAEIIPAASAATAVVNEPAAPARPAVSQPRAPTGPRPLDPALPRERIEVPAPELKQLICPMTGAPRQAGFLQVLEVLARRPAEYFVKRYERTVFVSPAKSAPSGPRRCSRVRGCM